MANLTIKSIPDSLHRVLKRDAEELGRSLNSHILRVLELSAVERARRRKMRTRRKDLERFVASLPHTGSSVDLIREDRER